MRLAERLANSFSKEGIILDEDKEIIIFGLESIEGDLLGSLLVLAIGICFDRVLEAIFMWVGLYMLRKNAGGFHADTKIGCIFMSVAMLLLAFLVFALPDYNIFLYGLCTVITGSVIWVIAPIDNAIKQLDSSEYKVFRKRSRVILSGEGILFTLAAYFQWQVIIRSIAMVFFLVSISLLLGIAKNTMALKRKES